MHKVIHSKFEIDLSNYNISLVEENHWFSDKFFTKYSFPFDIYINDDLMEALGDFLDDNNQLLTTVFNVQYVCGDILELAVLEIENQKARQLSATIRYGFDELPNFNKFLNELPLEITTITDIIAHAKTIISQTWPAVNYNYPQIHTDKYNITAATWATFLQIINNYDGTNFLSNSDVPATFSNANIIQPTTYLLHILTQGFLDAGFTLKGDITTHPLFQKICLFADIDYFNYEAAPITSLINKEDYTALSFGTAQYNISIALGFINQKYRVTGVIKLFASYNLSTYRWNGSFSSISYKDATFVLAGSAEATVTTVNVDFEFTTDGEALSTQILQLGSLQEYAIITGALFDLQIEKVIASGANEVHIKNEVNLTKVVPKITFGTLISELKNWFNIDIPISGNDIYMNFIENNINYNNAEDLMAYLIRRKKKSFLSDKSFLLKFKDVDNAPTPYLPVYQNYKLTELNNTKANDNTNIIEINALPLPNKTVETINTAFAFDHAGDAAIYFVLYNGVNGSGLNLAADPSELLLPNVHASFWKKWFTFRTNSQTYNWKFKMYEEGLRQVISKLKIFAYGQYHIIKTLNKTQISDDLYDVDIETESLK